MDSSIPRCCGLIPNSLNNNKTRSNCNRGVVEHVFDPIEIRRKHANCKFYPKSSVKINDDRIETGEETFSIQDSRICVAPTWIPKKQRMQNFNTEDQTCSFNRTYEPVEMSVLFCDSIPCNGKKPCIRYHFYGIAIFSSCSRLIFNFSI